MPAPSTAMQQAAAIALNHPEKLHKKNRSLLKMSDEQLRHFAETRREGLPEHTPGSLAELGKAKRRKKRR